MARIRKPKHIIRDFIILGLSIVLGYIIYRINPTFEFETNNYLFALMLCFVAGMFFTSAFTITPAGVILAQLMQSIPAVEIALIGAFGALFGDLIIFTFIRDNLSEDLNYLLQMTRPRRYKELLKLRFFHFMTPLVGALIIASPLPDELGLAMLGISKTRTSVIIPISYGMNFLGIILIAVAIGAF